MSNSFAQLKKNRQSFADKINAEVAKMSAPANAQQEDTRFWKPNVDKAGNGFAVIRFLPAPVNEDVPFVRVWDHAFKGPGGWYIEKSLTTFGEADPVSEYNRDLWATGDKEKQQQVRNQKRRLSFISNIYVVKDPSNPENEGKVFLYRFGKKIFDKLNAAMSPEFEDEESINPFDLWEGANFKLKIRKVEGYQNYDKSEFEAVGPLLDDDDEMERVWKQEHSLEAFLDRANFKSYDALKARLHKALGLTGAAQPTTTADSYEEDDVAPPPRQKAAAPKAAPKTVDISEEDDDEGLDYFKRLAAE